MVAKPFTLRGWEIPPGVGVAAISAIAHIDPVVWPEPHAVPEVSTGRTSP
jgi:cytochrome P450